jgi:hypothetical protein
MLKISHRQISTLNFAEYGKVIDTDENPYDVSYSTIYCKNDFTIAANGPLSILTTN